MTFAYYDVLTDITTCTYVGGRDAAYNRHVAKDGYQDERVNRDVGRDVDQEMHETTRHLAENPTSGPEQLVGGKRRNDDDKTQIGDRKIQQQQIRRRPHLTFRQDDVDNEQVADDADEGDDAEEVRHDELVHDELEQAHVVVIVFVVVRLTR